MSHRGDFKTSTIASEKYDEARVEVAKLINAEPMRLLLLMEQLQV